MLLMASFCNTLTGCGVLEGLTYTENATVEDLRLEYVVREGECIEIYVTALSKMKDLQFDVVVYHSDEVADFQSSTCFVAKTEVGQDLNIGWYNLVDGKDYYDAVRIDNVSGKRAG